MITPMHDEYTLPPTPTMLTPATPPTLPPPQGSNPYNHCDRRNEQENTQRE